MLMMLGDFDFQLISALTGPLGVSLFLVFMMVTFMTLANITIAVICNSYDAMRYKLISGEIRNVYLILRKRAYREMAVWCNKSQIAAQEEDLAMIAALKAEVEAQ